MLKRYQVLLNDWLADHAKDLAQRYGLSFSEVIRLALCFQAGHHITRLIPKCKFGITDKEISSVVKRKRYNPENFNRLVSKTYFEARKSIECWQEALKKGKK